jgi:hypothetical protein
VKNWRWESLLGELNGGEGIDDVSNLMLQAPPTTGPLFCTCITQIAVINSREDKPPHWGYLDPHSCHGLRVLPRLRCPVMSLTLFVGQPCYSLVGLETGELEDEKFSMLFIHKSLDRNNIGPSRYKTKLF